MSVTLPPQSCLRNLFCDHFLACSGVAGLLAKARAHACACQTQKAANPAGIGGFGVKAPLWGEEAFTSLVTRIRRGDGSPHFVVDLSAQNRRASLSLAGHPQSGVTDRFYHRLSAIASARPFTLVCRKRVNACSAASKTYRHLWFMARYSILI